MHTLLRSHTLTSRAQHSAEVDRSSERAYTYASAQIARLVHGDTIGGGHWVLPGHTAHRILATRCKARHAEPAARLPRFRQSERAAAARSSSSVQRNGAAAQFHIWLHRQQAHVGGGGLSWPLCVQRAVCGMWPRPCRARPDGLLMQGRQLGASKSKRARASASTD